MSRELENTTKEVRELSVDRALDNVRLDVIVDGLVKGYAVPGSLVEIKGRVVERIVTKNEEGDTDVRLVIDAEFATTDPPLRRPRYLRQKNEAVVDGASAAATEELDPNGPEFRVPRARIDEAARVRLADAEEVQRFKAMLDDAVHREDMADCAATAEGAEEIRKHGTACLRADFATGGAS